MLSMSGFNLLCSSQILPPPTPLAPFPHMGLGRWVGMELLGRWRVQSWVSLPLEAANWGGLMGPPQPRSSRALHERGNPIRAGELPAPEPRGGDMGHEGVPQAACLCLGGMALYGKQPSCPGLVVIAVWGLSPWWVPRLGTCCRSCSRGAAAAPRHRFGMEAAFLGAAPPEQAPGRQLSPACPSPESLASGSLGHLPQCVLGKSLPVARVPARAPSDAQGRGTVQRHDGEWGGWLRRAAAAPRVLQLLAASAWLQMAGGAANSVREGARLLIPAQGRQATLSSSAEPGWH